MIRRCVYGGRNGLGAGACLTVLAATTLVGSLTACATDFGTAQSTAFTADGHPRVGASQSACDGGAGSRELVRTELYFGTSRVDGARIAEDRYQQFMDEVVTPRFGDNVLLLHGRSQSTGENGTIVREPAVILVLFHPYGDRQNAAVGEVMNAFRHLFQGETVKRVDSRACVAS
jgi:hypothetical protein